jgi:hypothetical protein
MHAVCTVHPRPPSQWNPSVDPEFDAICMKCLEKPIEKRCQSAVVFVREIRAAIATTRRDKEEEEVLTALTASLEVTQTKRQFLATGCFVLAFVFTSVVLVLLGVGNVKQQLMAVFRWLRAVLVRKRH